ncbi:hypothetical protein Taro_043791 [Colocasia esculenta]|uniref:Uncharacterized protein n=1 Tax=Colocasia esculenta TaxID=4460 RepID=A0A843X4K7_COLES|nr:hypothetical protein [Colocasia esculenta]
MEQRGKRWGQRRRVVCRALLAGLCLRDQSVSPSRSPDPWAAVPTFRFLVGAEGPGLGAVTVNMPPRTRRQAHELVECQEFESDGSVAAEHVPIDAKPQTFE